MTFTWQGRDLELLDHPYNATVSNERAVEIPAALAFLERCTGRGLEVGNVLGHYGVSGHDVVDLYETAPGVRNIDVFDVDGTWDWIVSISTLEHVGWDQTPRDESLAVRAVEHLYDRLASGGSMFVTVPLGYHAGLDKAILAGVLAPDDETVFVDDGDGWQARTRGAWRPYGAGRAHAVWVATWVHP